jgi:hypothetical protein
MLKTNKNSMFDSLLPRVFVTRATIEDTGNLVGETNPHIDFEGEVVPGGSLIKVGSNLKFSNSSFGSKQMRVSLDLVVSDTTSSDICFSWLSNFDLKKYLNIYIFPVFNPSIVKSGKKEFFAGNLNYFLEPNLSIKPDRNFIKIPMSQIGKSFSEYSRADLQDDQKAAAFSQTINSANPTTDSDGNTIYDFAFNAVHTCMEYPNPNYLSYYLLTALDMDAIATDYPELQSINSTGHQINPEFISPITVLNVFEDNDIIRSKTIFLDPTGKVWTGDVHKFQTASSLNADDVESIFMSGLAGATDSVPLTRRTVKSYNIIDNRTLGQVMPNQINFSILHNSIDQRITTLSKTRFKDINKGKTAEHSYIGNAFLSSDTNGNIRYFFTADLRQMFLENSRYAVFFESSKLTNKILQKSKIEQMRVVRRQLKRMETKKFNELSVIVDSEIIKVDESDTILATATQVGQHPVDTVSTRTSVGSLVRQQVYVNNDSTFIRHYTGVDKTLKDVSGGEYQYGVEFKIRDGAIEYMNDLYKSLRNNRKQIMMYYMDAMDPKHYDYKNKRYNQSFMKKYESAFTGLQTGRQRPVSTIINWTHVIDQYIEALELLSVGVTLTDRIPSISELKNVLISLLHPVSGNPDAVGSFMNSFDFMTASLEKIIGEDLTYHLKSSVNHFKQSVVGLPNNKLVSINKFFRNTITKYNKETGYDFLSISRTEQEYGLEADGQIEDGLLLYTDSQLKRRMFMETKKYYQDSFADKLINEGETGGGALTTFSLSATGKEMLDETGVVSEFFNKLPSKFLQDSFSYLSPSVVNVSGRDPVFILGLGSKLFASPSTWAPSLVASILLLNKSYFEYAVKKEIDLEQFSIENAFDCLDAPLVIKQQEKLKKLFGSHCYGNVTVNYIPKDCGDVPASKGISVPGEVAQDVGEFVDDVVVPTIPVEETMEHKLPHIPNLHVNNLFAGLIGTFILDCPCGNLKKYDVDNENNIFAKMFEIPSENLFNLQDNMVIPNQVKSLILDMSDTTDKALLNKNWGSDNIEDDAMVDPANLGIFYFNYQFLTQIEYLKGYKIFGNKSLISDPIFERLTRDVLETLKGKTVLCRLKKHVDDIVIGQEVPCLELPIYNEYFLLNISSAGAGAGTGARVSSGTGRDAPIRPSYDAAMEAHADDGRPLDEVVTEGGSRIVTTSEGETIGGGDGTDDGLTNIHGGADKPGVGY